MTQVPLLEPTLVQTQASGESLPAPLPLSTIASDKQQQRQQQQGHPASHATSRQQQQQQQLPQQQQQQAVGSGASPAMPSAPNPNPLQQLSTRGGLLGRPELVPGHSRSNSSGLGGHGVGVLAGERDAHEDQVAEQGNEGGQARSGREAAVPYSARADDQADDELSMIEAEVAMLHNFGGSISRAAAPNAPAAAGQGES